VPRPVTCQVGWWWVDVSSWRGDTSPGSQHILNFRCLLPISGLWIVGLICKRWSILVGVMWKSAVVGISRKFPSSAEAPPKRKHRGECLRLATFAHFLFIFCASTEGGVKGCHVSPKEYLRKGGGSISSICVVPPHSAFGVADKPMTATTIL